MLCDEVKKLQTEITEQVSFDEWVSVQWEFCEKDE